MISQDASAIRNDYERSKNDIENSRKQIESLNGVTLNISQAIEAIEINYEKTEDTNRERKAVEEKIVKAISECKQSID